TGLGDGQSVAVPKSGKLVYSDPRELRFLTIDRWQQIKSVFQAAAELESSQRAAYLAQICAGQPELRQEVEALLASSDEAGDFIEEPALQQSAAALAGVASDTAIGRRVGAYRVTGEIGSGGMGTVYRSV